MEENYCVKLFVYILSKAHGHGLTEYIVQRSRAELRSGVITSFDFLVILALARDLHNLI